MSEVERKRKRERERKREGERQREGRFEIKMAGVTRFQSDNE